VGLDPRSTVPSEAQALILRRLFRIGLAATLGRAWAQKSPRWVSIAGAIVLFRFIDKRAANAGKRAKRKSA
jgi:hypothetical protein